MLRLMTVLPPLTGGGTLGAVDRMLTVAGGGVGWGGGCSRMRGDGWGRGWGCISEEGLQGKSADDEGIIYVVIYLFDFI